MDSSLNRVGEDVVAVNRWLAQHPQWCDRDVYFARCDQEIAVDVDPWAVARRVGTPTIDHTSLEDMMFFPLLPSSDRASLLSGVSRLRAPMGVVREGTGKTLNLEEGVRKLNAVLGAGISDASKDFKRVGVLVTGGLDSAVVAALVARQTGEVPLLITARGGLSSPLEIELQDQLARYLGSDLLVIDELPAFSVDSLLARNTASDFPSGGVFTHIWDFIAATARDAGVQVIFTGEGGNEVFSPGSALAHDQLRLGSFASAVASFGRARSFDGSTAFGNLIRSPARSILVQMHGRNRHDSAATAWRGRHGGGWAAAVQRRNDQFRKLRAEGYSYVRIDSTLSLERSDLYHANSSVVQLPFCAPLMNPLVREVISSIHIDWRNPVKVGFQDKYLLRLVGRSVLPQEITETRKIGISNQIAVILRDADVSNEISRLASGAEWAGLSLDKTFANPELLPTSLGLEWTRLLAIAAWATQGLKSGEP